MRRLVLPFALAVTALLAACGGSDPSGVPLPLQAIVVGADTVPGTGSLPELRAMREKWVRARDGRDYTLATAVSCFCGAEHTRPVLVAVQGSEPFSVRDAETLAERPTADYWTIERLFDLAIAERERGGRVRVTYSRRASFPAWIEIGTPENDAGAYYTVSWVRLDE